MLARYGACPLSTNFPSCQLVVLVRCRLPLTFPRFTAYRPSARTFMQPGSLQEALAGLRAGRSSLSRATTWPPGKPVKRARRRRGLSTKIPLGRSEAWVEESSLSQDTRSARARRTCDRIMTDSRNPARDRGTRVTGEPDHPSPASASNHRSQVSRAERGGDLHAVRAASPAGASLLWPACAGDDQSSRPRPDPGDCAGAVGYSADMGCMGCFSVTAA
jgi:hypothetical protein